MKCIAVATDGSLKRLAITFDEIDEATGKVTKSKATTIPNIITPTQISGVKYKINPR